MNTYLQTNGGLCHFFLRSKIQNGRKYSIKKCERGETNSPSFSSLFFFIPLFSFLFYSLVTLGLPLAYTNNPSLLLSSLTPKTKNGPTFYSSFTLNIASLNSSFFHQKRSAITLLFFPSLLTQETYQNSRLSPLFQIE